MLPGNSGVNAIGCESNPTWLARADGRLGNAPCGTGSADCQIAD